MNRVSRLTAAAFLLFVACGDNPAGTAPTETGIILPMPVATDTIEALIAPFVIEIRDAQGRPKSGAAIRLTASTWEDGWAPFQLVSMGSSEYAQVLDLLADTDGRVSVGLKLGTRIGIADLLITVPGSDLERTAEVAIRPGSPVVTGLLPRDTVIHLGGHARLRAGRIDRLGHATATDVAFVVTGNLRIENDIVLGEQYGHGTIQATYTVHEPRQTLVSTTRISVAPSGEFVAFRPDFHDGPRQVTVETSRIDGSQTAVLSSYIRHMNWPSPAGAWPVLSPSGEVLVHLINGNSSHPETPLVVTHLPTQRQEIVSLGAPYPARNFPLEFDSSGRWLYFTRGTPGNRHTAWRIDVESEAVEQVSPPATWGLETSPSPSPDGNRIVYATNHVTNSPILSTLRVRDLATGAVDSLDVPGGRPRWSPRGDLIAYLDAKGQLWTMRPDGTEVQALAGANEVTYGFSWSPDGEWLIMSRGLDGSRLELIEVATGTIVPLWSTTGLAHPYWHRIGD